MRAIVLIVLAICLQAEDTGPAPVTGDEAAKILAQIKAEKDAKQKSPAAESKAETTTPDARDQAEKLESELTQFYLTWLKQADLSDVPLPKLSADPRASELEKAHTLGDLNLRLQRLRGAKHNIEAGIGNPAAEAYNVREFMGIGINENKELRRTWDLYIETRKR